MAGSRNFRVSTISRSDLVALTEEAARVSGIPYVIEAYREEAERILTDELSGVCTEAGDLGSERSTVTRDGFA